MTPRQCQGADCKKRWEVEVTVEIAWPEWGMESPAPFKLLVCLDHLAELRGLFKPSAFSIERQLSKDPQLKGTT